jgi:hypothetical protein
MEKVRHHKIRASFEPVEALDCLGAYWAAEFYAKKLNGVPLSVVGWDEHTRLFLVSREGVFYVGDSNYFADCGGSSEEFLNSLVEYSDPREVISQN